MSRDIAPFGVRMPAELKAFLEKAAKENGRSLNAEVVSRLESSTMIERIGNETLSASEALEVAKLHINSDKAHLYKMLSVAITEAAKKGLTNVVIQTPLASDDYLESHPEYKQIVESVTDTLEQLGYRTGYGAGEIYVFFDEDSIAMA